MKHKRLNRDSWVFQDTQYYQMRLDCDSFHGIVGLIRIPQSELQYWQMPKAGKIQITGNDMTWLGLIPDHTNRVITVMYFPDGTHDSSRKYYPEPANTRFQPSEWYVDVIDGIEYDENGIVVFIDKYLDVIFSPEGDVVIDDRDELDDAYASGELTKEQYDAALAEGEQILADLCSDIAETDRWCAEIREIVERKIEAGAKPFFLFHGSPYDFDQIQPMQAHGQNEDESLYAIYAAASAKLVIPFALPIRWYPDSPEGKRSFECKDGKTTLIYGSLDPNGVGYIYRIKSDSFDRIDEWQWISHEECRVIDKTQIKVRDYLDTVEFSKEAEAINAMLYGESGFVNNS